MPRTIDVHAPADHIDCLIERLNGVDGIVSLSRSPGASLDPAGDRLTLTVTNDAMRPLFGIFEELRTAYAGTVSTSEVASLIARDKQSIIDREDNETVWDEMAFLLRSDTNLSVNYLLAMALAGAIAAAGLWADTIHVIVGAMIIAPAFEPLARLPFGLIIGSPELAKDGLVATLWGYLALIAGAAAATLLLAGFAVPPPVTLNELQWVAYWKSISTPGLLASACGGLAGAVVIGGQRSVLTTGVMVTLALIPSAALVGMGLATADLSLAAHGVMRWSVDAVLVITLGGLVFALKQRFVHRRRALS